MPESDAERQEPNALQLEQFIAAAFSLDGIKHLCERLGVEYEEIPGATRSAKARELVRYMDRRGLLPELRQALAQLRPKKYREAFGEAAAVVALRPIPPTLEVPGWQPALAASPALPVLAAIAAAVVVYFSVQNLLSFLRPACVQAGIGSLSWALIATGLVLLLWFLIDRRRRRWMPIVAGVAMLLGVVGLSPLSPTPAESPPTIVGFEVTWPGNESAASEPVPLGEMISLGIAERIAVAAVVRNQEGFMCQWGTLKGVVDPNPSEGCSAEYAAPSSAGKDVLKLQVLSHCGTREAAENLHVDVK